MVPTMTFVRTGLTALGMFAAINHATAADLYPGSYKDAPVYIPPPMWQGFYIGVNGGYGWRATSDQFSYPAVIGLGGYPAYDGIGANGGFGGGQIGFNWQGVGGYTALLLGIEADIQGSGISRRGIDLSDDAYKIDLNWFGTVRGRLGLTSGPALFYLTGGFAYGALTQNAEDNSFTPPAYYRFSGTATGYVVGGGIEYMLSPSWSIKAEYQYFNLGKNDLVLVSGPGSAPPTASMDGFKITDDAFHTIRIGLNYHIHQEYQPLK